MSRRNLLLWLCLLMSTLTACAGGPSRPGPILGEDPTISWTAVTATCDGAPLTPTYNIYAIAGPGPMPTVPDGAGTVPCGERQVIDTTAALKLNAAPITSSGPVKVLVPSEGEWTFCVEAVKPSSGARSGIDLGSCVTRIVQEPPGVVGGVVIAALGAWSLDIRVARREP